MKNKIDKPNPIVVADTGWAETLPDWLFKEIQAERMIRGMIDILGKEKETYKDIGDCEVLAYLLTASIRAPLDNHHTNIHLYLTKKVMRKRLCQEKINEMDFLDVDELSNYEKKLLNDLKYHIWKRRGGKATHPILSFLQEFQKEIKKKK